MFAFRLFLSKCFPTFTAKIEIYFSGEDDEEFYLAAEGSVARISRFEEKSQDMKSEGNSKTNDSRGNTHQPK